MNLYTLVSVYLRDGHGEITVLSKNEVLGVVPKDKSNIILKLEFAEFSKVGKDILYVFLIYHKLKKTHCRCLRHDS